MESGNVAINISGNKVEEKPKKTEVTPLLSSSQQKSRRKPKSAKEIRAQRAIIIATVFTLLFMVGEIVGGYLASSLAIMTDAAHLLTDVAAMLISLFAMTISRRPADGNHTFGYHRAEILGALFSIILIWALVGILCYEAILRLLADAHRLGDVVDGKIMTIIGSAGLGVNIINALILHWGKAPHGHSHSHGHSHGHGHDHGHGKKDKKKGEKKEKKHKKEKKEKKEEENVNIRAAFIHVVGDCLQSVGVIAAALVVWIGNWKTYGSPKAKGSWYNMADPIASLLFGFITLITTISLLRQIVNVLMERVPAGFSYEEIHRDLRSIPGVTGVHDLHIWSLSIGKVALSAHINSDDAAEALKEAEKVVKSHGISHSTIQVDSTTPESCMLHADDMH